MLFTVTDRDFIHAGSEFSDLQPGRDVLWCLTQSPTQYLFIPWDSREEQQSLKKSLTKDNGRVFTGTDNGVILSLLDFILSK